MRVLISSIGSRGDVQPILALAVELKALGHTPSLCVAPNFKEWIESYGVACIPIEPDLKKLTGGTTASKPVTPSKEQWRQLAAQSVREQFRVLTDAVLTADLLVGAGGLQIAARSVAETRKIPYVFVAYCPAVFPSPHHPPANAGGRYSQSLPGLVNRLLWMRDERTWNPLFRGALNEERAKSGLAPVSSVPRHIFTERPWLAADPVLAPAAAAGGLRIVQTGAWFLQDSAALPDELEHFLAGGPPPVYLGFGSMRAEEQAGRVLLEAARGLGLRTIISQGWAGLSVGEAGSDCIVIGDVNHERLFSRVAVIVHHGGSGTTTAAARAGKAQAIVPHNYDQFYWAHRVQELGVGVSGFARGGMSVGGMRRALRECLRPEMPERARSLSSRVELHGARMAAERLVSEFG